MDLPKGYQKSYERGGVFSADDKGDLISTKCRSSDATNTYIT